MKQFLKNSLLFTLLIVVYWACLFISGKYQERVPGSEIYLSITKSKTKTPLKKLIIGDSTANQLFSNKEDNDSLYSLACNQAISVCGHYFLLKNFLEAGNKPEEVYMVYNVFSFANNLEQIFTFHYFLKPFYNDEYKPFMTSTVHSQAAKVPYHQICQFPLVRMSSWSPLYNPQITDSTFLSPISREYLGKIDSLSHHYNFKLYLVPSLMDESMEKQISSINRDEFEKEKYADKLMIYLDNVKYLSDKCFKDGTHLREPSTYRYLVENNMAIVKKEYISKGIYPGYE